MFFLYTLYDKELFFICNRKNNDTSRFRIVRQYFKGCSTLLGAKTENQVAFNLESSSLKRAMRNPFAYISCNVLLPSIFPDDAHVAGENLQSTTMTSTTSTSFGSEMTDTVSNSMNTEEVSDADFTDTLQRGTIVAVAPMELTFTAQLGYCDPPFHFCDSKRLFLVGILASF